MSPHGLRLGVLVLLLFATRLVHAAGADLTRISLPTGPGSIEGLGKSFTSSISSGTASYGIDIIVPPGSAGFGPKLSFDYDGGGGVNELGTGWRLGGLVSIRRRTQDGLPEFGPNDGFELHGLGGSSELVKVSANVFRSVEERGSFARVSRDPVAGTWEVRDKAGTRHLLGGAGFEESEGGKVVAHLLREQRDLHGHVIEYEWDTASGHGLLKKVVWNDFGPDVRNSVELTYESRSDTIVRHSSGIRQTLTKRLASVTVRHGSSLVRRYELGYATLESHSVLERVAMIGRDGTSEMPPLRFHYTEPSYAADGQLVSMTTPPGHGLEDPNAELADLDGDGLTDLLVAKSGAFRAYVNHDGKSWQPGLDWASSASPSVSLSSPGAQLADIDGDGALDLVVKSGSADFRFFPGESAASFGSAVKITTVPNVDFDDADVQLADMDGDRRADAVITTPSGWAIAYNKGGSDWGAPEMIGPIDPKQTLRFSDGHSSLCDVNGDRVLDACYLLSGSLSFWLGRGRGVFEAAASGTGIPSFEASSPWQLRDLNGDGWIDLVHVGVNQVRYALAVAPGQFGAQHSISGVPEKTPSTVVRFADMNGSGTTDIVWVDVSGPAANAWRYLELFPDGRGGLLRRIDNGLGSTTTIAYGTAAEDAARARDSGNPWGTRINVAMPVVRSVRVESGLEDPPQVTRYTYRDGVYDVTERTFAAFGAGEQVDEGDQSTPTLITKSTFDTGNTHRVLRGMVLSVESRDEAGTIFSRADFVNQVTTLGKSLDGRDLEYAYRSRETKLHVEGSNLGQGRTTLTEWEQDDYGNPTAERAFGEVVAGDPLAGGDESITLTSYANDPGEWVLGREATREIQDAAGKRVSMTRTYYDGAPFQGLPLGQITRGNPSRIELWVGPGKDAFVLQAGSAYDADGNVVESRDARGGSRRFSWDATDHTSLTGETLDLGTRTLAATTQLDAAFGKPLSVKGFDGQTTLVGYDAFGRVTAIARPGDTLDRPTLAYEYRPDAPLSRVITQTRMWSGKDDVETSETLIDARGRTRGRLVRDDSGRWVLEGAALLDARGNARRTLLPRFVTQAEHDTPPLSEESAGTDEWRDATGRTTKRRTPSGITTKTLYVPLGTKLWDGAASDPSSPYEHTPAVELTDGLGRLASSSHTFEGKLLTESYRYDASGNMLEKTDPEGHVYRFGYDGRGLRVSIDDPDAGKHQLEHDETGNLIAHYWPDGRVGRDAYDLAGRKLSEDWDGDGKPEVELVYDEHPDRPSDASYRGRLVSVRDPSGSTSQTYDARGNVAKLRQLIEGHAYETSSSYDAQDRLYLHGYPDGSSLRIHRNLRGQVSGYGKAVEIAIDADGQETQRSFNTGMLQLFGYDADRLRRGSRVKRPDGSILQDLEWSRDGAGNVLSVKDKRAGVEPAIDRSESYAYDNLYRLRSASGSWGKTSWDYSPSGNLIRKTSTRSEDDAGDIGFGKNAGPHAMTSYKGRTLKYDAVGRLTHDGVRSYQWDAFSNLIGVETSEGASVASTFGASHERRVKLERDATGREHRTYFLSPWSEVRDGVLVRYIVHDGQRIARLDPGTGQKEAAAPMPVQSPSPAPWPLALLLLLPLGWRLQTVAKLRLPAMAAALLLGCGGDGHEDGSLPEGSILTLGPEDALLFYDGLGTLTEVARATGEELSSLAVFPYGRTRYDSSGETDKYTGVPRDSSVELDQMQARWYAPELGVWTSVDPLNWRDPTKKAGMPFAAGNPYAYAGCQPTTATDPTGECPPCAWVVVVLAGFASGFAANSEYDRQIKAREPSSLPRVIAASVIAGEGSLLSSQIPVAGVFGESIAGAMALGAVRGATVSGATYGATVAATGQPFDNEYFSSTVALGGLSGAFSGMLSQGKANWDMTGWTEAEAKSGQMTYQITASLISGQSATLKSTAFLPSPKPSPSSAPKPTGQSRALTAYPYSVSKSVEGRMDTQEWTNNMVKELQSR